MTIHELLAHATERLDATGCTTPRLDAEVLLAHVVGVERAELIFRRNERLPDDQRARFDLLVNERMKRRPVAQLTHCKEFWSRRLYVDETVLTPRPETEGIIERAITCFSSRHPRTVLDLCTGSGCIAAALADVFPHAYITATDISLKALAVARRNLSFAANRVHLLAGDLFDPLEESICRRRPAMSASEHGAAAAPILYDLIVSNPPYIPANACEALPPEVRDFEPPIALAAGVDGLAFLSRIAENAPRYLAAGGWLICEMGLNQAPEVQNIIEGTKAFTHITIDRDLAGIERIVAAQRR